ncbi:MAG: hypothetical protein Q8R47_01230 [Nanoarchaeota archaeon]|nr:hypothetical protein [Nanoarchaeota archaeon]
MISIDFNYILSQLSLSEKIIFFLIPLAIVILIIGIIAIVYGGYQARKLSSYLKKNNPAVWRKRTFFWELLANFKTFNPAIWSQYNPIENIKKLWQYIFNDQDTSDPKVLFYKQKIRPAYKIFIFSFAMFAILLLLTFVLFLISGAKIQ